MIYLSAGHINMPDFVSSDSQLEVSWNDFSSQVGMFLYYFAMSDEVVPDPTDCREYVSLTFIIYCFFVLSFLARLFRRKSRAIMIARSSS